MRGFAFLSELSLKVFPVKRCSFCLFW